MLKKEVRIGAIYKAQVSNKLVNVRIMSLCPLGGWFAVNLSTHKQIRVKSAQRLRGARADPGRNLRRGGKEACGRRGVSIVAAVWPGGFQCRHCGSTIEPVVTQRQGRGWSITCRDCHCSRYLEDKKAQLLRRVPGAIEACACVCVVYRVSLLDVLYPSGKLNGKMPAYRAKVAIRKELSRIMVDRELACLGVA